MSFTLTTEPSVKEDPAEICYVQLAITCTRHEKMDQPTHSVDLLMVLVWSGSCTVCPCPRYSGINNMLTSVSACFLQGSAR